MADPRLAAIGARLAAGNVPAARELADALLADSGVGTAERLAALVLRARAHEAMRDLPHAIADLDAAVTLDPTQARVWNELALLRADSGDQRGAVDAFAQATRADPRYARAWNNLGNGLRALGRIEEAVQATGHAVAADPAYALAWSNLGALKRDAGDDAGAETALRRALALDPEQRSAWLTLGGLLRDRSVLGDAAQAFERVCALDPANATAALQWAGTLAERDELDAARAAYRQAQQRDPAMLRALLGERLTLPMIPGSTGAIALARNAYDVGLGVLERDLPARLVNVRAGQMPDRLLDELRWSNFLLAYQGEDDKPLQQRYGALVQRVVATGAPQWLQPLIRRARGSAKIRVGFVSTFFRDGTVGRYFEHWITALPREQFDVVVYHLLPGADALAQRLKARADQFRHCPWWRPSQLAPQIRADALDVLIYPELGMGAVPFALAALRLAPLQVAAWGHPVTTGHAAIDVFLSAAVMEPDDGAAHYTERLVTLPGIGTRYAMPAVPAVSAHEAGRAQFGLPHDGPLLLCPQSLFKMHPDNDALFARVLRELPTAYLVMFEGRDPQLTARFAARLAAAGVPAKRTCWLPQCAHDDYLRINTLCTAMLDTLHWSGGNTTLDALACALPVVTLPGRFMRGRQSAGMLRLMDIDALIARDDDDYVDKVRKLVEEPAWREEVAAQLRAARHRVFDDDAPLTALAAFLHANA